MFDKAGPLFTKSVNALLALVLALGVLVPGGAVSPASAYASGEGSHELDVVGYIEDSLDGQLAAAPEPTLLERLFSLLPGADAPALSETGHYLMLRYLLVDSSEVDASDTIDTVWHDKDGLPVVGQYESVAPLYDAGDYYVALANDVAFTMGADAVDWSFTEANNNGVVIEGPVYDERRHIAYIPKELYFDKTGAEKPVVGVVQQLMVPIDITEEPKAEVSVHIDNRSAATAVATDQTVEVPALDVTTTIPVATPETASSITLDNIHVTYDDAEGSVLGDLVDGENAVYDQKTGELTLATAALSSAKVTVTVDTPSALEALFGAADAHAATAADMNAIPYFKFTSMDLSTVTVGDRFSYQGSFIHTESAGDPPAQGINAVNKTSTFGYGWFNNSTDGTDHNAGGTYALSAWVLGSNDYSAAQIVDIAFSSNTSWGPTMAELQSFSNSHGWRSSVAYGVDMPANSNGKFWDGNSKLTSNNGRTVDFAFESTEDVSVMANVLATVCGHGTQALGNQTGDRRTGVNYQIVDGTIHMRVVAKGTESGKDYVVLAFLAPEYLGQAGVGMYKFYVESKGGLSIQKRLSTNGTSATTRTDIIDNPAYSVNGAQYVVTRDRAAAYGTLEQLWAGRQFTLWTGQTNAGGRDGYAASDKDLAPGTYYIREHAASKGCELDDTVYTVTVSGGDEPSANLVNVFDKPKLGGLSIQKESGNPSMTVGNSCYSLDGAEFVVTQDRSVAEAIVAAPDRDAKAREYSSPDVRFRLVTGGGVEGPNQGENPDEIEGYVESATDLSFGTYYAVLAGAVYGVCVPFGVGVKMRLTKSHANQQRFSSLIFTPTPNGT